MFQKCQRLDRVNLRVDYDWPFQTISGGFLRICPDAHAVLCRTVILFPSFSNLGTLHPCMIVATIVQALIDM